jgi:hypothetical protein
MKKDAAASTVFHPMGNVVATCSGQRHRATDELREEGESDSSSSQADNSLKVWSLPFLGSNDLVEDADKGSMQED